MNRNWTFTSAVIVAALSVAVLPAGAQGRERGGRPGGGGGQGGGGQAQRQQSAQQAAPGRAPPQARQSAPPQARQSAPPQARQSAPPQAGRVRRRRLGRVRRRRQCRALPEPAASDRSAGDAAHEREPSVPGAQATPRAYQSRPLPTAPQAMPRANENRQYPGAQATPRATQSRPLPTAAGDATRERESAEPRQLRRRRAATRRGLLRRSASGEHEPPEPGAASRRLARLRAGRRTRRSLALGSGLTVARRTTAASTDPTAASYGSQPNGARSPYGGSNYGRPNGSYYARPYHSQAYIRPPHYAPYRPYYFGSSYYSFRPYWNIGFGLWVGYSVPYPYSYFYAGYAPRVYGTYYSTNYYTDNDYYGVEPYMAKPSVSVYGGVSFDIQPSDADLFIDGEYVGTVGTFSPTGEPLTLTPGEHRIAIQRDGFRPMEWDVTIEPGQVIPYRGMMEKL